MPISHLTALAAQLLEAREVDLGTQDLSYVTRLRATFSAPRQGGPGGDLYILRSPAELPLVFAHPAWSDRRAFRAVWIIDSFWTDMILRPQRQILSKFDLVCYTRQGDGPDYEALCGERALFLGWGADALDLGSDLAERPYDILRIGRQPEAWDDDARTGAACAARGLRFHGRPPFSRLSEGQQAELMREWYAKSKFVIAHSNLAAPAGYTHPTREYITARWTDAIASGATIAGAQPRSDLGLIRWQGAVLDTGAIDLEKNLDQIADALQAWRPGQALRNRLGALEHLDWRWRLAALTSALGCAAPRLEEDLARLRAEIARTSARLGAEAPASAPARG